MGHPVITAREANDAAATGDFFRQFQRGFYRIGTGWAGELQTIFFALAWQQGEQVFRELVFQRSRQIERM
ncbi:hypothetical protein D3C85_1475010 [compost metagenome]